MRLQDNTDFTTLTWVKPELDETLRQARNALQNYVEEGESPAELRTCSELLHQVQGTLRMVELYGAAMVAEEMEQLSRALIDAKVDDRDSAYAALMQGIVQLPDYLERLQSGHRDIPIVLLPLLNNLRESRGEKGLNESVLFSPDLSRELPPSAHGPQTPMDPKELGRRAEMLRGLYQGALLRWLKDDNSPATIRDLTDVCEQLVPITWAEPARRLFWVAAGTLDALGKNAFPISNPLKQALAKVEREIKRLADGGDAAFRVDPPIELTKQLLYFVAHEGTDVGRIGEIRSVFGLSGSGPTEAELAHARGSLSGNNRALLETVAVAIKEDLLRVKDALDLHLRTPGASLDDLSVQADALDRVADTLGMLGLGVPRRVVQDQRSAINDVISGQRKDNEDTLLDIAGALLYVEAALDDQVERLGKEEVQAPGSAAPAAPSNESRRLLEVLVKEAIVNFAQARQSFVAFVETHWDHAQLAEVPRLLTEVAGALRILEIPEPADYLAGVRQFTENELLQRKQVPNGQQMDRLADALASLEYYLEALRDRRPNREQILEVARQSLSSLGYWPLHAETRPQTLADAVPSPAATVEPPVVASVAVIETPAPAEPAPAPAPVEAFVPPVAPPVMAPTPVEPSQATAPIVAAASPLAPPTAAAASSTPSSAAPVVPGFDGSSGEEIDDEIREVFLEEFEEEIENLGQLLPAWRQDPGSAELLRPIRRVFHTLKGSGRLVGAKTLGEFSWKVESLLNRVLDGSRPASLQVIAMVQLALDTLPLLRGALAGEEARADLEGMQATADQLAAGEEVTYSSGVLGQVPEAADVEVAEMDEPEQPYAEPEPELEEAPSGLGFSIDPVLLEILKPEVAGHLEVVDAWLAECAARGPQPVTDPLVRSIHTMNGAFAMTELVVITDVTAPLEGFVKRSLAHNLTPSAEGVALVADAANAIRETILAIGKPRPVLPQFDALSARAHALRDSLPDAGRPAMPVHADEESGAMPQVVMLETADLSAIPDFASDAVTLQSAATTFEISEPAVEAAADAAAAEPVLEEFSLEEPALADFLAEGPAVEARAAEELAAQERAAQELAAQERAAQELAAQERAAEERAAEELAAQERAAEELAAQERAAEELAAQERAAEALAAQARAAEELAAQARAAEELAAQERAAEELAAQERAAEELAAQERAAEELEAQERAAEELAAQERATEELAAQELAAQELAAQEPVFDAPAFEETASEATPLEAEERQEIAAAFESQAEIEARAARVREEEEFARDMAAVAGVEPAALPEITGADEVPQAVEAIELAEFSEVPEVVEVEEPVEESEQQVAHAEFPESELLSLEAFLRGPAQPAATFSMDEAPEQAPDLAIESPQFAVDEAPTAEQPIESHAPMEVLWVDEQEPADAPVPETAESLQIEVVPGHSAAVSVDMAEVPEPVQDVTEDADAALASMIGAFETEQQVAETYRDEPAHEAPFAPSMDAGIFTPEELAGADELLEAPVSDANADNGYYGLTLDELEAMTAPAQATEAELPVQVVEFEVSTPMAEPEPAPEPAVDEAEAETAVESDAAAAAELAESHDVESDGFAELPSIGDVPAWTPAASEEFASEEPAAEPESQIVAEPEMAAHPDPEPEPEREPEPAPAPAHQELVEPEPEMQAPVNEAELLFDDEDEDDQAIQEEPPVAQAPQPVAAAHPAQQAATGRPRVPMARDDADPDESLDLTDLDTELLDLFLEESNDILDHSDGMLARLRDHADDRESIINLQRDLHTLKGGARMAGIFAVGDLGHAMESLLESVAEGRQRLDATGVVVLERGFDRLHGMVARIGERKAIALPAGLIAQVEALSEGKSLDDPGDATDEAIEAAPQLPRAAQAAPSMAPLTAPVEEMAGEEEMTGVRAPQEQVRIRADLLDRLVNYAGEVAIYRARLEQQLGAFRANLGELDQTTTRLREQLRRLDIETEAQIVARYQREGESDDERFDPLELDRFTNQQQLTRALNESANDLVNLQGVLDELTRQYETLLLQQSRVSSDLQEGLMRTRMVPFDALVPRLRRVLRQAATDTGKQVQLKVDGASGEMDRNVLERMTAPLEHMLRNAMAHGLELPEDRRKARKPEEGMVRIAVQREGSEVVLKVTDDGRGLDKEAIRRKAIERGLIKADAELSDEALYGMILESGFSTAETVSRLSGRGVGMDVVYSEIRQLGGTLQIRSEQGKGSEFIIRLPFTLAVTQAVFVKIGETSFAVPIASVRGVGRIARADLDKQLASEHPVFNYAGEDYAIHDLGHLIGHAPAKAQESLQMPLLLARSGDLRTAISIDQVLGSREIVVKPVGPQVNSVPGIFGATIMGDGRVVVILDVAPLVRRHMAVVRDATPVVVAPVVAARRVPVVMVVDDSITMRKVTGRVLERNNMEVLTAKDGVDAVEKMAERVPDLVLLDIEMPRMDGYEVAQNMRSDPRLKDVPIIMITSRTGDKHRQRAMDIGVNRYLGKPYQEPELMRNVFEMLGMESVNG